MKNKKTKFEELYSQIMHTNIYNVNEIMFYYEGDDELLPLCPVQITSKHKRLFTIYKITKQPRGKIIVEYIEIPEHIIWVVIYEGNIIFDRRKYYKGEKSLALPEMEL